MLISMSNFISRNVSLLAALCTVAIIFGVYNLWKHRAAEAAAPANLALRQKCASDGASYYKDTLLTQASPQTIANDNASLVRLYGEQAAQQNGFTKSISFSEPQYALSTKLNTCLIYYVETSVLTTGTVVNYFVTDVYTNKYTLAYFEVDGRPGNAGTSYAAFEADRID